MIIMRPVDIGDLDLICRHRHEMFREHGTSHADLVRMAAPFRRWLSPRLTDGRYFGFIAEDHGRQVGGVGLLELDWPPHPAHPSDSRRGYVLNVFVEPEYRRQGVASRLLAATEAEFARRNIGYAVLHSTALGAPLYESVGWIPSREMVKTL